MNDMDGIYPEDKGKEKNSGQIVSVRGSVVDIEFFETLPPIHSLIRAGEDDGGLEELSREDRKTVYRARRLERFFTQPFYTTTQFTGMEGKMVDIEDTIDGCERILNDEFSDHSESALYMIGAVGEANLET